LDYTSGSANANSFATTINGNIAQAQSTAAGSSGQAQATAQTNFGSVNSIQTTATSQVAAVDSPVTSVAEVGSGLAPPTINSGQSFSVANAFAIGPLDLVFGSMGAGYGGTGQSLTNQMNADFTFNADGGIFLLDLIDNTLVANGFDTAEFQLSLNGNILDSELFNDVASAQAFFSNNNLFSLALVAGLNDVQLSFAETMSSDGGFSFDYGAAYPTSPVPLPPTLLLFASGIVGLGWLSRRRKQSQATAA
jgi:hypothetical protein